MAKGNPRVLLPPEDGYRKKAEDPRPLLFPSLPLMKPHSITRKIADTALGAAVGALIGGPVGAVAGGLAGSHAATHPSPSGDASRTPAAAATTGDPLPRAALRRILVPVDFSPGSRRSLLFAREWATRFGAELCLLHVIEPMPQIVGFGAEVMPPLLPTVDLHGQARAALEKLAREELPEPLQVSLHLSDGIPWDRIATAAEELDADLIILSTHGRTGLSHALLGSNAERVVQHARCPVLTWRCAG